MCAPPPQLIEAAEKGNLAEVERLIAAGANVNYKDDEVTARAPTTVARHARWCRVSSLWRCCLGLSPLFPYARRVG